MQEQYDTLLLKLKENNYKIMIYKEGFNSDNISRLAVYCSPILMDDEVDKLKQLAGDGFYVSKMPNIQEIFLTVKMQKNNER